MTADNWLAVVVIVVVVSLVYGLVTCRLTPEERAEMLNEDTMFS